MDWILAILVFLHVMGAILAFGPTFAFPLIVGAAAAEPEHRSFAVKVQKRISSTLVTPLAVLQGITGLLIVWRIGFEILSQGWLLVSIVLYLLALAIAFLILYPASRVLVAAAEAGPPPAGAAAGGPPAHIVQAAGRARMASMVNSVLVVVIVFLMVTKPF